MPSGLQHCTQCTRTFNRVEHLQRHVRSHTKEKPFRCGACGRAYTRNDTLIRHAKSHCTGRRRMALSGATGNNAELALTQEEQHLLDENVMNAAASAPEISDFTSPFRTNTGFSPNLWGLDFIDEAFLGLGSIPIGGIDSASSQMHDVQFDGSDIFASMLFSGFNEHTKEAEMQAPKLMDLQDIWYTKISQSENVAKLSLPALCSPSIPHSASASSEARIVDEECRREFSEVLMHPEPQQDVLPASEFLDISVRRYLECFHPIFPIIHATKFQPTAQNKVLLISVASMGCLFFGSQAAAQRGRCIFERLNKAMVSSDIFTGQSSEQICALIQAGTIGQTFAMLSGEPKHLAIFDFYHGSLISFARRADMFEARPTMKPPECSSEDELEEAWNDWIRKEQLRRIVLALFVHDAEWSFLHHRDSFLRHKISDNDSLATSRAFAAATAQEWAATLRADYEQTENDLIRPSYPADHLEAYIKLESLGVKIAEDRRQGWLDDAASKRYEERLLWWYEANIGFQRQDHPNQFCLVALWHWTYINLFANLDLLESGVGRDGITKAAKSRWEISEWASTPAASRCMMHAYLLQKQLGSLRSDKKSAIHAPRILFSAAIATYCFINYGPGNHGGGEGSTNIFDTRLPEIQPLESAAEELSYISGLTWKQGATSSIKAATLCEMCDMLQHMNEWGLASRFGSILARLIIGDA